MNDTLFIPTDRTRCSTAACSLCLAPLRFYLGDLGQTVEVCDDPLCGNHVPHQPRPSGRVLKPYDAERKNRRNRAPAKTKLLAKINAMNS